MYFLMFEKKGKKARVSAQATFIILKTFILLHIFIIVSPSPEKFSYIPSYHAIKCSLRNLLLKKQQVLKGLYSLLFFLSSWLPWFASFLAPFSRAKINSMQKYGFVFFFLKFYFYFFFHKKIFHGCLQVSLIKIFSTLFSRISFLLWTMEKENNFSYFGQKVKFFPLICFFFFRVNLVALKKNGRPGRSTRKKRERKNK